MLHAGQAEGQIWDWQDDKIDPLYQEWLSKALEVRAGLNKQVWRIRLENYTHGQGQRRERITGTDWREWGRRDQAGEKRVEKKEAKQIPSIHHRKLRGKRAAPV